MIWEVTSWDQERKLLDHRAPVLSLAFSDDGRLLAASGESFGGHVSLWDLRSGQYRRLSAQSGQLGQVCFSPDGQLLACGDDSQVSIYDLTTESNRPSVLLPADKYWTTAVAFSPDGKYLAAVGWDGTLRLWAIRDAKGAPER